MADDDDILKRAEDVGHMGAYAIAFLIPFFVIIGGFFLCLFIGVFLYGAIETFWDWFRNTPTVLKLMPIDYPPVQLLPKAPVRVPPVLPREGNVLSLPPTNLPTRPPPVNLVGPVTPLSVPCEVRDAFVVSAQYAPKVTAPKAQG